MVLHMKKYFIEDFDGYVLWAKLPDGWYVVDPQFVNKFKALFPDAVEVSR